MTIEQSAIRNDRELVPLLRNRHDDRHVLMVSADKCGFKCPTSSSSGAAVDDEDRLVPCL